MFNKKNDGYRENIRNAVNQMQLQDAVSERFSESVGPVDEAISKWELDTRKELQKVELTFLGFERINGQLTQVSDPIVNKEGLYSLITPVKSLGNKITSLTVLSQEVINNDCLGFRKDIAKKIVVNRRRWNIKKSNRDTIIQTLDTLMNSVLNKAKDALLVRARREQIQTKEIKTDVGENNKGRKFPAI